MSDKGKNTQVLETLTLIVLILLLPIMAQRREASMTGNSQASLDEGLVAYWEFDEGEGNIAFDSTDNMNDAVLVNHPTWVQGKYGTAIRFSGVDSFAWVKSNTILNPLSITIAGWVKANQPNVTHAIMTQWWFKWGKIYITSSNQLTWQWIDSNNITHDITTLPFQIDTWFHFAITFDGNTGNANLYLNGDLKGSTKAKDIARGNNFTIIIGGDTERVKRGVPYGLDFFNGLISEIRIYNRALSDSNVESLFRGGQGHTHLKSRLRILYY